MGRWYISIALNILNSIKEWFVPLSNIKHLIEYFKWKLQAAKLSNNLFHIVQRTKHKFFANQLINLYQNQKIQDCIP